jgi:hypothetical protein
MVVDRLMALNLLEASELATWALHSAVETSTYPAISGDSLDGHGDEAVSGKEVQGTGLDPAVAWEVLYYGLERAFSRLPQVKEKQARKEEEVEALRKRVLAAAERASAESDAMPVPGPGNEVEIRRVLARVEAANNEEKVLGVKVRSLGAFKGRDPFLMCCFLCSSLIQTRCHCSISLVHRNKMKCLPCQLFLGFLFVRFLDFECLFVK